MGATLAGPALLSRPCTPFYGRAPVPHTTQVAQQQASLAQSLGEVANWIANRPVTEEGPKGPSAAAVKMK